MQVCTPIGLNCDSCYELSKIYNTSMNVVAGLTPATTPYLWLTDKFGNQYKNQISIAMDGSFNILTALFPSGIFTQYSGTFDIFVTSDFLGTTVLPMIFNSKNYNCIKLLIIC